MLASSRRWRCDVQNTKDGLRRATHIFEAAVWHYAVQVTCRCGHSAKFHAASLWWRFERKGWNDSFRDATRHFWCRQCAARLGRRSEGHTSELQSLMRISYAVFCLKKKTYYNNSP